MHPIVTPNVDPILRPRVDEDGRGDDQQRGIHLWINICVDQVDQG
jgi:hypothetical protein